MQNKKANTELSEENGNPMPMDSDEQLFTINVDGQPMELTLEQLIAAAEQGLSRANEAAGQEGAVPGTPSEANGAADNSAYSRFLQAYPEVHPMDIPESVWEQANRTGDLLEAYRIFEIAQLRQELEDLKLNQKNRARDVGSARSDGESRITDPIILALMGKG